MFVGICRVHLHLIGVDSLKGKRKIVKSLVERTRAKFNAAVAEVAENDNKSKAVIGITVVGNAASHVDSMLGKIRGYVEGASLAPVASFETEIIPIGDELHGSTNTFDSSDFDFDEADDLDESSEDDPW